MKLLRDLTLGLYLPGSSAVHALDPRAKLGACVLAMAATLSPGTAWGAVWSWPLLALGLAVSRVPLSLFLRGLRPFVWLFGFTVLLHGLATPGQELLALPWIGAGLTREGLAQGGAVSAQLATAVGFSSLLTLTTSPTDLVWALDRLGSPLRRLGVPVGDFCVTALLAIRFFPILYEEAERLTLALKARGIDPGEGGAMVRARNVLPLLVPLFRQVFHRAETIALAMEMRGYRPDRPRTSWRARGLGASEAAALGLSALTLGAALFVPLLVLGP
ncbi:MAG: energy-coupling factor transporter transmembrane component T [Deferrisomatales bacterium]|nr:energy-coupling factor transporter transmembrane component T [Deferrisomatales bacterium]